MDEKKGTIKNQAAQITIKSNDFNISNTIKKALASQCYDVISKPIMNDVCLVTGEDITVYQTETL